MQFLFQPLTWGFLLVGVPILVHLINMLRHRKQSWAAMDFLLESYRKHRRWVLLKQWLLLAARMLAMLLLVAMLARWISNLQSLSWFGGQVTHHYVLLDDSYSMAESNQGGSAYSRGLKAVQSLIRSISQQPGEHQLTLLRWSRAELTTQSEKGQARVDAAADLISQTVPRDAARLLDRIAATEPTAMQLSPEPALELVVPMISSQAGEKVEIYFVTDLRRNEWGQPESLKARLAPVAQGSTHVQFIDCAENTNANLSIVSMQPEQETWAAGVPLMIKFHVRNQGQTAARNVVVKIRSLIYAEGSARPAMESAFSGEAIEAPPIVIEEIAPGETALRQVQLAFSVAGQHVVEASLAEDRLNIDNYRWCVVGIRQSQQVLVIDGSVDPNATFFLKTALQPDGRQSTGMSIETRDASFLRDTSVDALAAWDVVVLIELPRMEAQAIANLEQYVRSGGGLAIFGGPSSNVGIINELYYRNGDGFFPSEVVSLLETPSLPGSTEPQVTLSDHPILAPLKNLSASPFLLVEIRKLLEVSGKVESDGKVEVVAYGPEQKPLVLDKHFGQGHVVAVLTGLTGGWSTWPQDPTFVVFCLRTVGYLGSFRREPTSEPVGAPISATFAKRGLLPKAEILLPAKSENARAKLEAQARQSSADSPSSVTLAVDLTSEDSSAVDALLRPGVYELWMQTANGEYMVRNVAHNVAGIEGNLARVTRSELEEKLRPIKIHVQSAESMSDASWSTEAASHSSLLLGLLVFVLLGEQALAYSASYHVPKLVKGGVE